MHLREIVEALERATGAAARWHGERAQCRCPAHEDGRASLAVGPGKSGGVVVYCHAGCETEDVLAAAGLAFVDLAAPGAVPPSAGGGRGRGASPPVARRPGPAAQPSTAPGAASGEKTARRTDQRPARIVATYDYADEQGALIYQVVRFDPKDFRQRRPDGQGGWLWSLSEGHFRRLANGRWRKCGPGDSGAVAWPECGRVLYRLPEILAADPTSPVWIVEGEKDADALRAIGLVATCNAGGAGKWHTLSDDSALEGRPVRIVPDRDKPKAQGDTPPGEAHAAQVAEALSGRARDVRIVRLPPGAKDASDWLALEENECAEPADLRARLERMAETAQVWRSMPAEDGEDTAGPAFLSMRSDTGNAARFARDHRRDALYCPEMGWLAWTGQRWEPDSLLRVHRLAKRTARGIFSEAGAADDDNERRALAAWAVRSQEATRLNAMMSLARCEMARARLDMDADPWLLNCRNGTLDLRTGELLPHRRDDWLTMLAPVAYDPDAACPLWLNFLARIMGESFEMIRFLQRTLGMALTADIREEYLWIFHGGGANGKSVLIDTVVGLMGDYATHAAPDMLIQAPGQSHPTEIADLCRRRLVIASETEEGKRLKLQAVKRLTGDAVLKGRLMRQDFMEFSRTHKLVMVTNNTPVVRERNDAVWRRLRLVPFAVTIPEAERDTLLREKLRGEWPGILAWLAQGCRDWLSDGLAWPEDVRRATAEYEAESDPLAEFLAERCTESEHARVTRSDIWSAYQAWAEDCGVRYPIGRNTFFSRLRARDGVSECEFRFSGRPSRGFRGIGLQDLGGTQDATNRAF